jgi:hypothetical protein
MSVPVQKLIGFVAVANVDSRNLVEGARTRGIDHKSAIAVWIPALSLCKQGAKRCRLLCKSVRRVVSALQSSCQDGQRGGQRGQRDDVGEVVRGPHDVIPKGNWTSYVRIKGILSSALHGTLFLGMDCTVSRELKVYGSC